MQQHDSAAARIANLRETFMKRSPAFKPVFRAQFFEADPTTLKLRRVLLAPFIPRLRKPWGFLAK